MFTIFIAANFLPSPLSQRRGAGGGGVRLQRGPGSSAPRLLALRLSRLTYQTASWLRRCLHCHSTLTSVFICLIPVDYLQALNEPFLFTVIEFFEEQPLIPLNFLVFANTAAPIRSRRRCSYLAAACHHLGSKLR